MVLEGRSGIVVGDINFGIKYPISAYLNQLICKSRDYKSIRLKYFMNHLSHCARNFYIQVAFSPQIAMNSYKVS